MRECILLEVRMQPEARKGSFSNVCGFKHNRQM